MVLREKDFLSTQNIWNSRQIAADITEKLSKSRSLSRRNLWRAKALFNTNYKK